MSPRTGRPPKDEKDKMNLRVEVKMDRETISKLDECVKRENTTRSAVVRKGILLVYGEK